MHKIVTSAPSIFAPKHGLVDSGNRRSNGDGRWENGVQFNQEGCLTVEPRSADCPGKEKSDFQECPGVVEFDPFLLELGVKWPNARRDIDVEAFLKRQMDVSASAVMEHAIWDGVVRSDAASGVKVLPHRLMDTTKFTTTTGNDALHAVGIIEDLFLSDAQAGGTIHMAPYDADEVMKILEEGDDGNLYTKTLGSKVIIGNYGIQAVVGHAGDIDFWLSDDFSFDSEDGFKTNEQYLRVERMALVIWNPCRLYVATVQ